MIAFHDLFPAHQRAAQALQLFKEVCDTRDIKRTLELQLRGNTYRITYTPRQQLGFWGRLLSRLGLERRVAVRRVPPDREALQRILCCGAVPSESAWLRSMAKFWLRADAEDCVAPHLPESQKRHEPLRSAAVLYADCDVRAHQGGWQRQPLLYGAKPEKRHHQAAFDRAQRSMYELPLGVERDEGLCFEIHPVPTAVPKPVERAAPATAQPQWVGLFPCQVPMRAAKDEPMPALKRREQAR